MTFIDWLFVCLPLLVVVTITAYTRRHVKSVADFMAAGRCAGRYLLATAKDGAGGAVAVSIALFEINSKAGFTLGWWGAIGVPVGLLVAISGFVIYRYRETRSMTVAQFFEIRYSRRFRIFMGSLAFVAGVLNYGVFPAIGGRFFVYFLGLPETVNCFGVMAIPTWFLIAVSYLTCTLFFVLIGGQISLLISDCLEGILSQLVFIVISIALFMMFSWHEIVTVLSAAPKGESLINPFDTKSAADFNIWFILIQIFFGIYGTMAWQNQHAFNSSALTAHESRMGVALGNWRTYSKSLTILLMTICALTFLGHPHFAAQSAPVGNVLSTIHSETIQTQMRIPIALGHLLPVGVKGLFCAIMMLGLITGDSAHLHSWGSIFAQDVVLPLRKSPLSPKSHIRLLRVSMSGVALLALCISFAFRQTQYVQMWWIITTSVFLSGAGAVIIGGLYWKKGTTAGAWAAMLTGSGLSFGAILIQQFWKDDICPWLLRTHPGNTFLLAHSGQFPINSQYISLAITGIAVSLFVLCSLLTCRENFNMDRMLHRGEYAVEGEHPAASTGSLWRKFSVYRILGIDGEFNFWDRVVTIGIFGWSMFWFLIFVVGSVWNLVSPWPFQWWANYWFVSGFILPFVVASLTAVWFTIGGISDMKVFFKRLKMERPDAHDDGTVDHPGEAGKEQIRGSCPARQKTVAAPGGV